MSSTKKKITMVYIEVFKFKRIERTQKSSPEKILTGELCLDGGNDSVAPPDELI